MSTAALADPRDRVMVGIALTMVAYLLFSTQDALIKLLVSGIAVWQILFVRSIVVLAGCAMTAGPGIFRDAARSPILVAMILRSFLILAAWLCYYTAARDLQLAELTTIYFGAPVMVTVLSVLWLGEKVPLLRWAAVLVGFAGVFVACDPTSLGLTLPILLVLAAGFFWALSIVMIRKMAMQEKTSVQVVLNNAFFLVIAGIPTVFVWVQPTLVELGLMVAVGVLGGIAQFSLFSGMRRAEASVIAPFEYTSLLWAFVLGYLIWGDVPRQAVVAGAVLILFAGLIMIASERYRRSVS